MDELLYIFDIYWLICNFSSTFLWLFVYGMFLYCFIYGVIFISFLFCFIFVFGDGCLSSFLWNEFFHSWKFSWLTLLYFVFFFIFSLYIQHSSLFISIHFRIWTRSSNFIRLMEVLHVSLKCSNWFLNSICWLFGNYHFQIGSFIHNVLYTMFLYNLTGKVFLL